MKFTITVITLLITNLAWCQWRTSEVRPSHAKRQLEEKTLTLPFWDDFSASKDQPDTTLWQESENIYVNDALGIKPPSYKVATFDGLQQNGRAYRISGTQTTLTDNLTSHKIDLSTLSPIDSVYLSFFWQAGGNGEEPEERDTLKLKFYDGEKWALAWMMTGDTDTVINIFQQELIPIKDSIYFNSNFKFKFESYGQPSGPFDTWHVDYIYMNKARSNADSIYADRALTDKPTSLFAPYFSIPAKVFYGNTSAYISSQTTEIVRLDDKDQALENNTFRIEDLVNNIIAPYEVTLPGPIAFDDQERLKLVSPSGIALAPTMTALDSQKVQTSFFFDSGDNFLEDGNDQFTNIDLRINDTIRQQYLLQEHYAYDDGSAEFAAGISEKFGKIAMRYVIPVSDTLTHIDIHFPHIAPSPDSSIITIMVWNRLDEESIFSSQRYTIASSTELNQFQRIALTRQKVVKDTIYIGFQQLEGEYIPVGLDRNNPGAKGHVFYNITNNTWAQNNNLEGVLMIRPVFAKAGEIVLASAKPRPQYVVFPNPVTNGAFSISGEYDRVELYTLSGALAYRSSKKDTHMIPPHRRGIFIVKVTNKEVDHILKLIVE